MLLLHVTERTGPSAKAVQKVRLHALDSLLPVSSLAPSCAVCCRCRFGGASRLPHGAASAPLPPAPCSLAHLIQQSSPAIPTSGPTARRRSSLGLERTRDSSRCSVVRLSLRDCSRVCMRLSLSPSSLHPSSSSSLLSPLSSPFPPFSPLLPSLLLPPSLSPFPIIPPPSSLLSLLLTHPLLQH